MSKENKSSAEQTVKFVRAAFRYEGKLYKSADVEKAAAAGDEAALAVIANLVALGSGVIKVVEEGEEVEQPKAPKAKASAAKGKGSKKSESVKTEGGPNE